MRARYLIACLLSGVAVGASYGAVAGVVGALTSGPQEGPLLGAALGALLVGLVLGAALGALLGGVSGVVATLVARGTTVPATAALRVGSTVLVTDLVLLLLVSGFEGSVLDGEVSWASPGGTGRVLGVVVPSVLAAVVSAWAARSVADMTE